MASRYETMGSSGSSSGELNFNLTNKKSDGQSFNSSIYLLENYSKKALGAYEVANLSNPYSWQVDIPKVTTINAYSFSNFNNNFIEVSFNNPHIYYKITIKNDWGHGDNWPTTSLYEPYASAGISQNSNKVISNYAFDKDSSTINFDPITLSFTKSGNAIHTWRDEADTYTNSSCIKITISGLKLFADHIEPLITTWDCYIRGSVSSTWTNAQNDGVYDYSIALNVYFTGITIKSNSGEADLINLSVSQDGINYTINKIGTITII